MEVIKSRNEALKRKAFDAKAEAFDIDMVPWKDAVEAEDFISEKFTENWNYEMQSVVFYPKKKVIELHNFFKNFLE